jgi:hypothetical protein
MIPTKHIKLENVAGLENYSRYAVDIEGHIWTLKYRWPKRRKPVLNENYLVIKATNDDGILKTLYVHKVVAMAFLPTHNTKQHVRHKDGNVYNNHIDNLEWVIRKSEKEEAMNFILNQDLMNRIQQVHVACQKKGLKTGNSLDFTHQVINNALDEYIIRYGLRKVM